MTEPVVVIHGREGERIRLLDVRPLLQARLGGARYGSRSVWGGNSGPYFTSSISRTRA
jgi:hypothetical protein